MSKRMHHAVSIMKMVADFGWMVSSRFLIFELLNEVDFLIEIRREGCRGHLI